MRAIIRGDITLTDYSELEGRLIKERLSLPNLSYHQAIKRNPGARFFLSPTIPFYVTSKSSPTLAIPRGMASWLKSKFSPTFQDERQKVEAQWPLQSPTLRPHQGGVLEEIGERTQGLIVLPTAFGKTILALKLAQHLGQSTLIVAPRTSICEQFRETARTMFGVQECGSLKGPRGSSPITLTTIATLQRVAKSDPDRLRGFGCLLLDEAHCAVSEGARKVWAQIPAYYRYGLTGTNDRSDGLGDAIAFYFGDVLVERKDSSPPPSVILHPYGGFLAVDEYHLMVEEHTRNEERNRAIVDLARRDISEGRKVLILTKRIEHYKALTELLGNLAVFAISSSKQGLATLDQIRNQGQHFDALVGTYGLLGTGVDIPALDTLILAGDLKSRVLQRQAAGRILRIFQDKKSPVIRDIIDTNNPILNRQGKLRRQVYEELEWPISLCPIASTKQKEFFPAHLLKSYERL